MPKKTTKVAKKKIQELLKKSRAKMRQNTASASTTMADGGMMAKGVYTKADKDLYEFNQELTKKYGVGFKNSQLSEQDFDKLYELKEKRLSSLSKEYPITDERKNKMADGGISDRYTAEVGDEEIAVMVKGKEKKGYPVYARLSGYSPMTVGVYPTKEAAEKKASELRKRNKMEYGGALQDMTGGVNADPRFDIYNTGQFAEAGIFVEYIDPAQQVTPLLAKMADGGMMAKGGGFSQYGEPYGFDDSDESDSVYEYHYKEGLENPHRVWDKIDGLYVAEFPSRQRAIEWIESNRTYADGGMMAKGGNLDDVATEVLSIKKNILGTASITLKMPNMRKPQEFSVYPIKEQDAGKPITIQSDSRIGLLELSTGRGMMSQSHPNGAYFVHLQIDKKTPFKISAEDSEKIRKFIIGTAGENVGQSVVKSDNLGAAMMADGGAISSDERLLLENDGKKVKLNDGLTYQIKAKEYNAIYPYKRKVIDIIFEPISKSSEEYKKFKKILGDDWLTDWKGMSDENRSMVLKQLGNKMEYGGALQDMTGGVNADPRFDIYNTGQFADKGAVIESITGGSHEAVNPVVGYAGGGEIDSLYTKLVQEHSKEGYEKMGVGFDRFLKSKMDSAIENGNTEMYYKLMEVQQRYENDFYAEGGETTPERHPLQIKIENILKEELPNFYTFVKLRKHYLGGGQYLQIGMAASNYEINRVSGQYPQYVSLMLDLTDMDLHTQVFGGNGGDRIYLIPDKNDPKEKYLAMAGRKIPFRKPKPNEKNVLDAVRRFAQNYRNTLVENKDRLMYKGEKTLTGGGFGDNVVNYDEVLGLESGGMMARGGYFDDGGDTDLPFKKKIKLGKVAYGGKAKNKPVEITVELKRKPLATNWDTLDREKDVVVFSMSGGIWNSRHTEMLSGGQNLETVAKIGIPGYERNKDLQELIGYWRKYHLNDLKAGTKRQTEAVEKWEAEGNKYDYTAAKEYLKSIELDEDKGYKYGHGWLYEPIPDSVVSRIIELANKLDRDSYAMGGALEHGLMQGDHILIVKDDYVGVVNEETGKMATINISTGERTEVEKMEGGGAVSAAYRPDKIKNANSREYTENFIPFVGNNLSGMAFPNGDYLVSSYGYYPIWYYKKSEEKWYGNKDKFSVTTAKQMTQSRPTYDATMVSNDQMSEVIASAQEGDSFKKYGGTLN